MLNAFGAVLLAEALPLVAPENGLGERFPIASIMGKDGIGMRDPGTL